MKASEKTKPHSRAKPGAEAPTWPGLRKEALALIEAMNAVHEQWSDYNLHDPGITIMETLCYAISDLGYRLDFPIEDLLAFAPSGIKPPVRMFYTATQALPNSALSIDDYRRLLIDQEKINNAWIYPCGPTDYDVFVAPESTNAGQKRHLQRRILDFLNRRRNLCERFHQVTALDYSGVELAVDLFFNSDADTEQLIPEVQKKLEEFFTMSVKTYSFDEAQLAQDPVDLILEGPLPVNGFIPQSELDRTAGAAGNHESGPVFIFYADELQQALGSIYGVDEAKLVSWQAKKSKATPARLIVTGAVPCFQSATVSVIQNSIVISTETITGDLLNTERTVSDIEIGYPRGRYRHPGQYSTIQNQLPPCYGVGVNEIMKSAPPERKEQARQLRAYLVLFDQILCNSFAQLEHTPELLAMVAGDNKQDVAHSYVEQKLPDDAWRNDFPGMYESLEKSLTPAAKEKIFLKNARQKNKLLDYLLSLFLESYMPIEIFKAVEVLVHGAQATDRERVWSRYLKVKQDYLNRLIEQVGARSQKSALEKIIALKLALNYDQVVIEELLPKERFEIPNVCACSQKPITENPVPFAIDSPSCQKSFELSVDAPEISLKSQKPISENQVPFAIDPPASQVEFAIDSLERQKPITENPVPFAIDIPASQIEFAMDSLERQKPIPENPIPFQISSNRSFGQFIVDVKLPAPLVAQKEKTPLQEYARQIVSANIPAHISFTISPLECR